MSDDWSRTPQYPQGAAFVLGGSGMLGSAACAAFARHGVPVALSYHANREAAETLANGLKAGAAVFQVDGSKTDQVEAALAATAEKFGGLHSVVYAGGPRFKPQYFSKMTDETWEDWFANDALACIKLARSAIPHLRKARGAFTTVSTYQGLKVEIQGAASAVSKAAVDRMVAVMAKEEGRYGVRANAVRCGWIGGERTTTLMEKLDLAAQKKKDIPLGRLGYPDEVGETIAFLSSRNGGFITGQCITLDGGEAL